MVLIVLKHQFFLCPKPRCCCSDCCGRVRRTHEGTLTILLYLFDNDASILHQMYDPKLLPLLKK